MRAEAFELLWQATQGRANRLKYVNAILRNNEADEPKRKPLAEKTKRWRSKTVIFWQSLRLLQRMEGQV